MAGTASPTPWVPCQAWLAQLQVKALTVLKRDAVHVLRSCKPGEGVCADQCMQPRHGRTPAMRLCTVRGPLERGCASCATPRVFAARRGASSSFPPACASLPDGSSKAHMSTGCRM